MIKPQIGAAYEWTSPHPTALTITAQVGGMKRNRSSSTPPMISVSTTGEKNTSKPIANGPLIANSGVLASGAIQ